MCRSCLPTFLPYVFIGESILMQNKTHTTTVGEPEHFRLYCTSAIATDSVGDVREGRLFLVPGCVLCPLILVVTRGAGLGSSHHF